MAPFLVNAAILIFLLNESYCWSCVEIFPTSFRNDTFRYCEDNRISASRERQMCRCHNIHYNGRGDGDCQSFYNGRRWCYIVGDLSGCRDKRKSAQDGNFAITHNTVFYSEEACEGNPELPDIGNENFLPGYELTSIDLAPRLGGGGFYVPTPEACETECYVRKDYCDNWTFLPESKGKVNQCYLKRGGCIGQQMFQLANPSAISGYLCRTLTLGDHACWSSSMDAILYFCPIAASQSFGQETINLSGTTGIGKTQRPGRYRRLLYQFVNGRWRAVRRTLRT